MRVLIATMTVFQTWRSSKRRVPRAFYQTLVGLRLARTGAPLCASLCSPTRARPGTAGMGRPRATQARAPGT